jgi:hypothetical protein
MSTPEPDMDSALRISDLFRVAADSLREIADEVSVLERRWHRRMDSDKADADFMWETVNQLGELRNETEERAQATGIVFHDFAIMDLGLVGVPLKPLLDELQRWADAADAKEGQS